MKRILVPIDFSEKSTYAAKTASQIALLTQSELYLLHIVDVPVDVVDPVSYNEFADVTGKMLYIKKTREKFKKFKQLPFLKEVDVKGIVTYYDSYEGIIKEAEKHEIDLIVMGSKGTSRLDEMLIGSNTEKVVRNSEIPVLVVKNDMDIFNIKNVVFASDFNLKVQKTFQNIIDFTATFDATLHLLRVTTIENFETSHKIENVMEEFTKGYQIDDCKMVIYNDMSIEEGVINYADKVNADIIAINTHQRRGLAHLFKGSISQDVSNHAKLPVITFKV